MENASEVRAGVERKSSKLARWFQRALIAGAWLYPVLLAATALAFVTVGEDWWVTAALLYVPRWAFAAPLAVLLPGLLVVRQRRHWWSQLIALTLVLFPLMGLVLPWPARDASAARSLKLMSFNICSAEQGEAAVLTAIDAMHADVVLLQEVSPRHDALLRGLRARFAHVEVSTQFVIASRFAIIERVDPGKVFARDRERSPRFVRYVLDSPLGKLAVYSIHPISPRGSLGVHRFRDLFHVARTGELLQGDAEVSVLENATLREQQVAAVAAMAKREKLPVLLAGDTNLPGLSAALHRHLSSYRDAFRTASWGFGYTYPQRHAFLRLDRILGSQELDFSEFQIGCAGASDHFCVASRVILR